MEPLIIYGSAVRDARNRLRSAQISAMYDILGVQLFVEAGGGSDFAVSFSGWVNSLQEIANVPDNPLQNKAAARANRALSAAKARNADFIRDQKILDLFAIGDILRYLGEFFEFGGGADPTATEVDEFRAKLRNQIAFNRANRARQPVSGYDLTGHPDLGIFMLELLDRSTVKYMERFYGPYVGADISGTTTDALDVLAYYLVSIAKADVTQTNLKFMATGAIQLGEELVPIASMVLQYHHSLIECGLALGLPNKSMGTGNRQAPAISTFNLYDYSSLAEGSARQQVINVLARANAILAKDLAGCGLIVLRDEIDIDQSPYADVEIGVLMEKPAASDLFKIPVQYPAFSEKRRQVMLRDEVFYENGNPSLAAIAVQLMPGIEFAGEGIADIISMNSMDLAAWAASDEGRGKVFENLDDALKAAARGGGLGAAQQVAPHADLKQAAVPSAVAAGGADGQARLLKNLDPAAIDALQKLLSAVRK